jgi:hypothetical protein
VVVVTEIPGRSLTEREWRDILLARRSYAAMWGGGGWDILANDPLDGRDSPLYDTRHYLAWVRDGDEAYKLVTMRKVRLVASALSARRRANPLPLLPIDIQMWRTRSEDGRCAPLWEALKSLARRMAPRDELAEFRIASLSRMGTYPYAEPERTRRKRERTAVAYAAIQVLATYGDPSLLFVHSLCPEFQNRVLGVVDVEGVTVTPAFTRTEDMLGLPTASVGLDNALRIVRQHRASFPGYFVDNDDAARVIAELLDEGRLTVADLRSTVSNLVEQETLLGRDSRQLEELVMLLVQPDHGRLAEILTRPHLFKYLIPVIAGERPLSRMTLEEFRRRVLYATKDGPFSSTVVPSNWVASVWAVLEAAEVKSRAAAREREWAPVEVGARAVPRYAPVTAK